MKIIKKIAKFIISIAIILACIISLPACNHTTGEELTFEKALANTNEIKDKGIDTNLEISLILYDEEGEPIKLSQNIFLQRVQKDNAIYIKGDTYTPEFKLSSPLQILALGVLTQIPSEINLYLKNKAKGFFEVGYKDDVINLRGDIYRNEEQPDYKIAFKDKIFDIFFATSYADVLAQQQAMEFDFVDAMDAIEMVMQSFLPAYDFANLENKLGNRLSVGLEEYQYQLTIPSADIFNMALEKVDEVYNELMQKSEEEEEEDMLEWGPKIYGQLGFLQKWINIEDIVLSASADKNGVLTESSFASKVTIKIPDEDILYILTELEVFSEKEIKNALALLHTFITSTNGVKNVFEINFIVNVQESYNYNPTIDLTSAIFIPLSVDLEDRTVLRRIADEDGDYRWTTDSEDFES